VAKRLDRSRRRQASALATLLDGDPVPPPLKGNVHPPIFGPYLCCCQMAGWIKMALGMQVGLGPGHTVLDGYPAPLPKKGTGPQFSAHVHCGKTAGWIKVPLGTEVGLGPGHIVLDGDRDPAPPEKRQSSHPIFGPCLLWPNGCTYQDTTQCEGRPQPRRLCIKWGPSSPSPNGAHTPIFGQCPLWPNGWMD